MGKSSLLNQYIKKDFSFEYKATIGADFLTKEVVVEDSIVQLQLWDTAGTERFHSLGRSFYRNAECCILVFDLTEQKSFESIETYRKEFLDMLNPSEPETFPFVLLGNKSDLEIKRKVQESEINKYCESKLNMPYFETSAKDNINVEAAFEKVSELAFERNRNLADRELYGIIPNRVVLEGTNLQVKHKKCCPL